MFLCHTLAALLYKREVYRNVRHQDLRHVIDTLPFTLMNSKAKNTTDTCLRGLVIWKEWIANFEDIEFLLANSLDAALCTQISYSLIRHMLK